MCTHLLGRYSDNGYVDDMAKCVCSRLLNVYISCFGVVELRLTHIVMCSFLFRIYIRSGCLLFYRLRLNDDYTEITLYPCSQVKTAQMNIILHMRKRNVERLHQSHCPVPPHV